MTDLTEELHDELDAFDPRWKEHYPSIGRAAIAADVIGLYSRWVETDDGKKYIATIRQLPDHVGRSKREAEAAYEPRSLPFGYGRMNTDPVFDEREFRPK